jgi:hypothetical protein
MPRRYLQMILAAVTFAGLCLLVLAYWMKSVNVAYPTPIILLTTGAACTLLVGLPWAHMPGWRGLKSAFFGLVGFFLGGALGGYAGNALAPNGPDQLGAEIALLIGGFWVGAILFAGLGIWWGLRFHRRKPLVPDGLR